MDPQIGEMGSRRSFSRSTVAGEVAHQKMDMDKRPNSSSRASSCRLAMVVRCAYMVVGRDVRVAEREPLRASYFHQVRHLRS